ncbi:MAG: PLP-dependent aminotransferase family protein [Planctomycetes bacterium]|nr:PLP-dependent aminotransferase family protein [Planctomycetota bacterium]
MLYEDVAAQIQKLIESGTYRVGERVPSLHALSRAFRVSVTTALSAYHLLESRGMIAPRPKSGYYVRPRFQEPQFQPSVPPPPSNPTSIGIFDRVMMVLRNMRDSKLVQLGTTGPPPEVLPLRKLRRVTSSVAFRNLGASFDYDAPPGCHLLRVQIARRSVMAGCVLRPDDVLTTCGGQEALSLGLRAICRPGDLVAVESPIFYGILLAMQELRLRVIELPSDSRSGLDLGALRTALRRHSIRAVVAMPTFNNPLGGCMPADKKKELVKMLAGRNIPLIEDDVYGEIFHGSERPEAAKSFDTKGLVLLCSSFSKTLSPGSRVGWIVPGRFTSAVRRLKIVSTLATPTLPQLAIAEFLAYGGYERHLRTLRKVTAMTLGHMAQAVRRSFPKGTRISTPAGGMALWVELPERADSLKLYDQALQSGITIAPGPIFSPRGRFRNFIRLSGGSSLEKIESAIATLGRLVAKF